MSERVKARATVETIGPGQYRVHVWGLPPHEFERWYEVDEIDENKAAFRGIELFVEEMDARDSGKPEGQPA